MRRTGFWLESGTSLDLVRKNLIFRDDPIFRREVDLPKRGRGLLEFNPHLCFSSLNCAHIYDAAGQRLPRGLIGYLDLPARRHRRRQRNERAMSVHNERPRFFAEILTRSILAAHRNRDAQQHSHTAPPAWIGNPALLVGFGRTRDGHNPPNRSGPSRRVQWDYGSNSFQTVNNRSVTPSQR
jgi:hypothetical protein